MLLFAIVFVFIQTFILL